MLLKSDLGQGSSAISSTVRVEGVMRSPKSSMMKGHQVSKSDRVLLGVPVGEAILEKTVGEGRFLSAHLSGWSAFRNKLPRHWSVVARDEKCPSERIWGAFIICCWKVCKR